MSSERQSISGDFSHKYFHQMLNMADDDLDPYEYRLLGHYVRCAGQGGAFEEGIRQTAKRTKMSIDKARSTRNTLCEKLYITVQEPTSEEIANGIPTKVNVLDRWAENITRYGKEKRIPPVQNLAQPPRAESSTAPMPDLVQPPVQNLAHSEELVLQEELKDSTAPEKIGAESAISPTPETPTKPERPQNPMYNAIRDVWHYAGGYNHDMEKMLAGKATKKAWKDGNLETPITSDELLAWAAWYRKSQLHDDPKMNMLEERAKIASSITAWQEAGKPDVRKPTTTAPVSSTATTQSSLMGMMFSDAKAEDDE